jgi:hypothetical protein
MAALLADAGKLGDLELRNPQRCECPPGSKSEANGNSGRQNARFKSAPKRERNRRTRAGVSLGMQSKVTGVS